MPSFCTHPKENCRADQASRSSSPDITLSSMAFYTVHGGEFLPFFFWRSVRLEGNDRGVRGEVVQMYLYSFASPIDHKCS
jgi:hypothetical protein